jgi:hypothetical protein
MSATATANDLTLADLDDDFPTAKPGGYKTGDFELSALADGEYTFQIASAELKKNNTIFELKLELLTECQQAGGKIQHPYFFTKKDEKTGLYEKNIDKIGQLKKDLTALGFDVDNWTKENGRPFSVELPKTCLMLQGMRVVCKKKTGGKKNATEFYHNLYIDRRGEGDGLPEKIGAKELEEANVDPLG